MHCILGNTVTLFWELCFLVLLMLMLTIQSERQEILKCKKITFKY